MLKPARPENGTKNTRLGAISADTTGRHMGPMPFACWRHAIAMSNRKRQSRGSPMSRIPLLMVNPQTLQVEYVGGFSIFEWAEKRRRKREMEL